MKKMKRKILSSFVTLSLIATIFSSFSITSSAAVTTSISNNSNELVEVENLIGHYQFNVAAGSNINSKGDRGYSHVSSMKTYEKDHSSKLKGNSSGGYLDGSYNDGGSIVKAYLVIETATKDYSLPDYPITFVAGSTNNKMETKVEHYCFDTTYSSGNERRAGYIDVTDFVKKNGYGWYYVCNIPYNMEYTTIGSDQFAGWKLIVVEENFDIPMRMLKLKIGSQNIIGQKQTSMISVSGEGIKTTRTGDVTGQFLFGMSGADPSGEIQANSVMYSCSDSEEEDKKEYKSFSTKSNVRTVINPLNFISSRNGIPLQSESIFENPVYFNNGNFVQTNTNGSYLSGSGDLELLDISPSSEYYHDVKLDGDRNVVSFKFETVTDCALMTSVLGIAVDIDVPVYENEYTINYDKEKNEFYVEGTLHNVTQLYDVGLLNPTFVFSADKNLTISSYSARITTMAEDDSAKFERKLSGSDLLYDKKENTLTFNILGCSANNKKSAMNTKSDTLYYNITLVPKSINDYYDNFTYINGTLFSSGTKTDLNLTKLSAKNTRNSLTGIVTKRNLGGKIIWNDNNDEHSFRPQTVEVSLCMDSVAIDTVKISGRGNIWEYSFDDLNIYKTFDYSYDYEALIKKEYEHYVVSYDETTNDITFSLEEKHIPENNIVADYTKKTENIIKDMSLKNIDLNGICEAYDITSDMFNTYKEILLNN